MTWIKIIYDTVWYRCHPFTSDEHGHGMYMTWRTAWELARI